ncbi:DEAD/DEAH box helicase [Roseibacillus persicicus]|uniref:DEAD/DEAH box helicase n=1 Tax=Roseibacillus persicicus TaxID=454148 RepID=UPI0028108F31|nr:ATP-binding protein [Roseibacillus persicicus]MDQ8188732.1 ATP-binding protein [Roseibacillus persicicus]
MIIKGEEKALYSEFGSIDLPPTELEVLATTASLLQRDTDLFYVSMVVASRDSNGKALHTPVLLYPVEVRAEGKASELKIDHSRVALNPALHHLFDLPATFENELLDLIPTGELNLATPGLIAKDLSTHLEALDVSLFEQYPNILKSSEIQKQTGKKNPVLLPASALLLTEKSKNVAGLLHELDELLSCSADSYPPALGALLGRSIPEKIEAKTRPAHDFAPALLSPAQSRLLKSADTQPLTVCHGPPGTGKSFTIAATAIDQIARGNSVLIACRSDEAAAVVEEKIAEMVTESQLVIRAGRKGHLKNLKSLLEQLLGTNPVNEAPSGLPRVNLSNTDRSLSLLRKNLARKLSADLRTSSLFASEPRGLWRKLNHWKHSLRVKRAPLLADLIADITKTHADRLRLLEAYNEQTHQEHLHKHLKNLHSRDTLKRYREALGRRIPASQEKELLALDLKALVRYLPIWITTTDDIHRVLPLKPAVFDTVIIDEATQCDLASTLPILYRGSRAFITGDPQQLRHLSFLSKDRLDSLAAKHQLSPEEREHYDFRKVSFLDRALAITAGTTSRTFLDEHFRSLPPLIAFSNEHFYHGNLHCMREVETLGQDAPQPAIVTHQVSGKREKDGINEQEISAVFLELRKVLTMPASTPSLGFLSPFRAQVDSFQERLQKEFTPSEQQRLLRDHQLIAGTAHSFQGAERDTMLLSMAIDPSSPAAARRFLERPDVFNVSITRARHEIQLFTSISPGELPQDSLLAAYLLHASEPKRTMQSIQSEKIALPDDLLPQLAQLGWTLIASATKVAGMPTDLIFKRKDDLIAIDLIGTAGSRGQAVSVEKTLMLKRAGLTLIPLSLAEWEVRKEDFLAIMAQ